MSANTISTFYTISTPLKGDILFNYKGVINQIVAIEMYDFIVRSTQINPTVKYKLYAIMIEMADNMRLHGVKNNLLNDIEDVSGVLAIIEEEECFHLISINEIEAAAIEHFTRNCQQINSLSHEALRNQKTTRLFEANRKHEKAGAGVGLLQIALLSDNILNFDYRNINQELGVLIFSVQISKET
ncbi:MAG: hypothetical protein EAZ55_04620 [Cytophagales bacterium]|nr:MAG: hypothetical protein EAZ55_04620 [Cytophagales bacterium]